MHAWLPLFPAAVLLVTFTHYPIVASLRDSLFSTPRGGQPAAFVGLDNYRVMLADPIFWRVIRNNVVFAVGTIPASIVLALVMATWVDRRLPARALVRLAYFTPTVLPMLVAFLLFQRQFVRELHARRYQVKPRFCGPRPAAPGPKAPWEPYRWHNQ